MTGVSYTPAGYDGENFPGWAEGLGWMMVAVPIVLILTGMIVQLVRNGGSVSVINIKLSPTCIMFSCNTYYTFLIMQNFST